METDIQIIKDEKNERNYEAEKNVFSNYKIRNLTSFQEVTQEPRQVAGLYFHSFLDCLNELAYKISHDFFKRPHLYTELGPPIIAPIIARLRSRYGNNEKILSKEQREEIYIPLFGSTDYQSTSDPGDFSRLRDELVAATTAFSERVYDTGVEMLKERVRTTHRPFKQYLVGLLGDSVRWSKEESLSALTEEISYPILRNKGVASVFGILHVPQADWPYSEDSNGDKLIEEISKHPMWGDPTSMYLTREQFSNLQRIALRGAEAIATIIDFDERSTDEELMLLITKCYTWGSALLSTRNAVSRSSSTITRK